MPATLLLQISDITILILIASIMSIVIGTPIGIINGVSKKNSYKYIYYSSNIIIQTAYYLPFIVFAITNYYVVDPTMALTAAAIPIFAKQISNSITNIPRDNWDHAAIFGASKLKVLLYIIIPSIKAKFLGCIGIMLLLLVNLGLIAELLK